MNVEFDTNDTIVHLGGDRWVRDNDPIFSEETAERIRQGYMCIACFQEFAHAFPERCTFEYCSYPGGFPVRELQSEAFARMFKGRDETIVDPLANEDRLREQGVWLPT